MTEPVDARQEAVRILDRVERAGAYASILLENAEPRFKDRRDRALLHALVLGVLRSRSALDQVLCGVSSRPLEKLTPQILQVLRVGVYMLTRMDRVPSFAVLDVMVGIATRTAGPGAAGFVNGVLRTLDREPHRGALAEPATGDVDALAMFHGHPGWLARRMVERLGEDPAADLMKANNRPARTIIRPNRKKLDSSQLAELLLKEGIKTSPCVFVPDALAVERGAVQETGTFKDGLVLVQDEASQLVPLLFGSTLSGRVLDACAAPGGKTMVLAEMADDGTEIVAVDRNAGRLRKVQHNAERLGHGGIRLVEGDITSSETLVEGQFDAILVDAPCSGTGTLRRHPEIRWRLQEADLAAHTERQGKILAAAARSLAPGGILVYGVCSMEAEEGQMVTERFLQENPGFGVQDPGPCLPVACRQLVGEDHYMRTSPVDELDGFFGARLQRLI
jgi:16S rRNA (cytosine967-C5)-methyltransferase